MIHVTDVRSLGAYRLRVTFSDGSVGQVDLADALEGPMFVPLRDDRFFAQVLKMRS